MNYSDSIKAIYLLLSMIFPKHRKNMLSNPELILSETENLVLKIIC